MDTHQKDANDEFRIYRQLKIAMHRMTGTISSSLEPTGYVDLEGVEQSSMDVPISDSNIGFRMLQKMGWQSGKGLGRYQQGRIDPVPVIQKADITGLGRLEEDEAMHEAATAGPRMMESERQALETEEERAQREKKVEKQRDLQRHLEEITSVFYCELCDKRYQKVSEWENHLSSYDHNHKKRFLEMRQTTRKTVGQKVRERDAKRLEKELARMQQAAEGRERARETSTETASVIPAKRSAEGADTPIATTSNTTAPTRQLALFNKKTTTQRTLGGTNSGGKIQFSFGKK